MASSGPASSVRRRRTRTSAIPSPSEYDRNELSLFYGDLRRLDRQPLAYRREAQAEAFEAMQHPSSIAHTLELIFNGSHGRGAQIYARQILSRPRANRTAQLTMLAAALDHMSPPPQTRSRRGRG